MRQRRGFTLLEMMVVVGVLLLLVTIAVAAYSKIINAMAAKATGTALENCQSLLAEFDQSTPIASMGYLGPNLPDPNFPYLGGNNVFKDTLGDPIAINTPITPNPAAGVGASGLDRYPMTQNYDAHQGNQNLTYKTAAVTMMMMRIPGIAKQINSMPPKSFLLNNGQPIVLDDNNQIRPAPLFVDGWNDPIIFVPASGLRVNIKQGTTVSPYIVRTSGMIADPGAATTPLLKTTHRPFWASAGPDGRFDSGDDNVYSFKQ